MSKSDILANKNKSFAKGGSVGNKEYELKSWFVDVHEDNYEKGEGDNVHNWSSSDYQDTPKTFDSKEELEDYIQEVIERSVYGHDFKKEYLDIYEEEEGDITINYVATASYDDSGYGDYNKPTEEELENWKKDNQKLFSVLFAFRVEVYEKKKLSYAKGGMVSVEKTKSYFIKRGEKDYAKNWDKLSKDEKERERQYVYNILQKKQGKQPKKENNEMLIGGIAGVLLGIFLNR